MNEGKVLAPTATGLAWQTHRFAITESGGAGAGFERNLTPGIMPGGR